MNCMKHKIRIRSSKILCAFLVILVQSGRGGEGGRRCAHHTCPEPYNHSVWQWKVIIVRREVSVFPVTRRAHVQKYAVFH